MHTTDKKETHTTDKKGASTQNITAFKNSFLSISQNQRAYKAQIAQHKLLPINGQPPKDC